MRRQGVGKALLSSVVAHTLTPNEWVDETTSIPLVLSVENDNIGAIQLYRHFGFEYVEKNKFFSLMLLLPTSPKILEC
jgi:ribosomal protein S18 acetylase RimI-like enzyme